MAETRCSRETKFKHGKLLERRFKHTNSSLVHILKYLQSIATTFLCLLSHIFVTFQEYCFPINLSYKCGYKTPYCLLTFFSPF